MYDQRPEPRGGRQCEGRCADGVTTRPEERMIMQVKTCVKAGGLNFNHNETLVRATLQQRSRV